jgi:putative transposase
MARQARLTVPDHPHLITQRGNNGQAVFTHEADYRLMLDLLRQAATHYQVRLHAYVLLPNSLQLLATPSDEVGITGLMQQVGRSYVRQYNQRHARTGTLFEGRYKSLVLQTERYLLPAMVHLDWAAVRVAVAAQPQDYAWSSYAHYAGVRIDPLVNPHSYTWSLGNTPFAREAAYAERVRLGVAAHDEIILAGKVSRGLAIGDAVFLAELEKTLQRRVRPGQKGRPMKAPSVAAKSAGELQR